MILAAHVLVYSEDPPKTRAFFRDVLGLPFVSAESYPEALIFRSGPSEFSVHQTLDESGTPWDHPGTHQLCFMVADIEAAVVELEGRGAVFEGGVVDAAFGRLTMLQVPGADSLMVYEAHHPTAYDL